jgi:glucan 1,4-alpha-glucosidase
LASGFTVASLGLALVIPVTHAMPAAAVAPGGPGADSHFDLARKDCLGTAFGTSSKVWYTVAGGVLSDVYYPTIDNTNVETLQYVVTDGASFTDLQARDMTYTVRALDQGGMECEVTSTAKSGAYTITTDYFTDPSRNTLLMGVHVHNSSKSSLTVYVRYDPTVNGNGGGGTGNGGADTATTDASTGHPIMVSYDTNTVTNAGNRDYAQPVFTALDGPFDQVSSGFAGTPSDGLVQLDASHALTQLYSDAASGNVVQTGRLALGPRANGGFTLALGFGPTQAAAVASAEGSLNAQLAGVRDAYRSGWVGYDGSLRQPPGALPGMTKAQVRALDAEYLLSANIVKASEDKTFPGAIVASLASPWGQAVQADDPSNTFFGSYREVFARDLYEAWTGLVADGDLVTARNAVTFLFDRQQLADGSMPRNSLLNGKTAPDSFNTQLDECSYPILMAWTLGMNDAALYRDHIRPAAYFVASHGPSFGPERWEEQGGYSPSTIAAEIAGLIAAGDIAQANGDMASARLFRGTADDWQRSIKGWTVTTNGPLGSRYFIRLSKTGDPNAAISYGLGNGGPTLDQRQVIDAGFLELARLGELPASDADIQRSLPIVDSTIEASTPSGPGWHRYNGDGYGDGSADGHPWPTTGQGTGHLWPVLSAERAENGLATGLTSQATALLVSMSNFASGAGLIPEQDWESPDLGASPYGSDPATASIGFRDGGPAGSAAPLTWSAGAFVRLFADIAAGSLLDQPANTTARYVTNHQGATTLTVSSPSDLSAINGSPVTVTGSTQPGNTVSVAATNVDTSFTTATAETTAAGDGSFSLAVAAAPGTTVISVVATASDGGTAHTSRTVVWDFVPGTKILDVTDPSGDDNGPGNYAYPTYGGFHPGAYDITDFQVYDDSAGSGLIIFRVQVRDLSPTFGSPLGAQLVDVYVHDPAAAPTDTSTAASFPQRNYEIAPGAAWKQLIEVQGFGQRYIDAQGRTVGNVSIRANQVSRYITFSVPASELGHPASGWGFTVVLTGQDGFSPDQARSFASTPQDFQFGVCATASSDPHCTVDPGTVPKAMDVVTPPAVTQSDELDYTVHNPVVLTDVTIP